MVERVVNIADVADIRLLIRAHREPTGFDIAADMASPADKAAGFDELGRAPIELRA